MKDEIPDKSDWQILESDIEPIMPHLWPVIQYVVDNQEKYDADIDIYGDFHDLLDEIEKLSS